MRPGDQRNFWDEGTRTNVYEPASDLLATVRHHTTAPPCCHTTMPPRHHAATTSSHRHAATPPRRRAAAPQHAPWKVPGCTVSVNLVGRMNVLVDVVQNRSYLQCHHHQNAGDVSIIQ